MEKLWPLLNIVFLNFMSLRQSASHSNQPAFGHFMTQMSQKTKQKKMEGKIGDFKYLTYVQVMAHLKQGSHISFMS